MKLQNMLPHMANSSVKVNGTRYLIDGTGVATVDNDQDAEKLLANYRAWKPYVERAPVAPKGDTPPPPPDPPADTGAGEKDPGDSPGDPPPPSDDDPPGDPDAGEKDPEEKVWDDPTMKHTKAELHEIAEAYQVEYNSKTPKEVLIKLIMEAMYGNEGEE